MNKLKLIILPLLILTTSCVTKLSTYISRLDEPAQGIAVYKSFSYPARGGANGVFTLVTNDGKYFEDMVWTINPDPDDSERYFGCKYRCWYDAKYKHKPKGLYICLDSLVFDEPPLFQVPGDIGSVRKRFNLVLIRYHFILPITNKVIEVAEYIPAKYYSVCKQLMKKNVAIQVDCYRNPTYPNLLIPQINKCSIVGKAAAHMVDL